MYSSAQNTENNIHITYTIIRNMNDKLTNDICGMEFQ
jgi:hypothetical protein